ncbi:uncharacterized protein LOC116848605 [Odontomachus brunneus]|uniref:uncharacterized protein LOC116848605 n=1 Tax=Odontomachus brunneus TaxID=486640 RepID=UPI0013F266B9|nr:uncharacterized protein LOC116848605 [Odontomachus brunneus]
MQRDERGERVYLHRLYVTTDNSPIPDSDGYLCTSCGIDTSGTAEASRTCENMCDAGPMARGHLDEIAAGTLAIGARLLPWFDAIGQPVHRCLIYPSFSRQFGDTSWTLEVTDVDRSCTRFA